jgi:N-acetylglucosamine-6-sulfatase
MTKKLPSRRDCLRASATAPALLLQRRRCNLVFILSDDHGHNMMSCMGHPWLKTPSLDRLAKGGALFRNSFCTTSLCSPSRASILTGQYAHAHGVIDNVSPLPDHLVTFPQVLQQHGYRTGFIGKWHMGAFTDAPRPGFDRWASFRGQGAYRDPVINFDGKQRKVGGYVSDILTEEALRFIGKDDGRPFMLYLGHKAPHVDFVPAERHKDLYAAEPIPLPKSMANIEENYRGKPDWVRRARNSVIGVDGMHNQTFTYERFYRQYCRTIMAVDDSVGRILDDLAKRNLLDNTLVVYMSDNGFLFGEHGLTDKRNMYEPSIRVPMIAHCPALFGGGTRPEGMALNIDIGPTFLDAAGVPAPRSMHGRSLLPLLRGARDGWRTDFLYEYFWERDFPQNPSVLGLRTERHSFMQYHGTWDLDEFYDIREDPDQMNNLLGDVRIRTEGGRLSARIQNPELKKLVGGFQQRMNRILAETGGRAEPSWKE